MKKDLLRTVGLSWQVADKIILDGISFSIQTGDFIGLLGPNGAGKTSLLRCLYRFNKPSSGQILFEEVDIWKISARQLARTVAVVLQETSSDFGLTVQEVVTLGLLPEQNLLGQVSQQQIHRVFEALEKVEMLEHISQNFHSLSGGEKQRVLIARAILQRPKLLILDEPTNHLDIHFQIETLAIIKRLGISVIASFHDLNLAATVADRLLLLKNGKLVAYDTPRQVISKPMLKSVFNVDCEIDQNPINDAIRISYDYSSAMRTSGQSVAVSVRETKI